MAKEIVGIVGKTPGTSDIASELDRIDDEANKRISELKAQALVISDERDKALVPLWDRLALACDQPPNIRETHVMGIQRKTNGIYIESKSDRHGGFDGVLDLLEGLAVKLGKGCGDPECERCKGDGDAD